MGVDHDGKFCYVWYLIKQKYPHFKGMKDIASATLIFEFHRFVFEFQKLKLEKGKNYFHQGGTLP